MTPVPGSHSVPKPLDRVTVCTAVAGGAFTGLVCLLLGVLGLRTYGFVVFLIAPFVTGTVTGYLVSKGTTASWHDNVAAIAATLCVVACVVLSVAFEGAICVVMSAPLAFPLALGGGIVGRKFAHRDDGPRGLFLGLLLLPAGTMIDSGTLPDREMHQVLSVVEIEAPAERVWDNVIEFPPLPEPTEWWFRAGIAYPRYASIEGRGVGAVRYCVFSTGPFVEPITAWEPAKRLAFDVTSFPEPMRELSPYSGIHPPHLNGYLRSRKGEFRLISLPGGRTRLEGRTWYELDMAPAFYWETVTDAVIHSIHRRVLDHIKRESERTGGAHSPLAPR